MSDAKEVALATHKKYRGMLNIVSKVPMKSREDASVFYTPGVAEPCKEIARDPDLAYTYTSKWNSVAVVTDGSAVLGLGNICGLAGMPVMEGKCVLFKTFGDVNAVPICLNTQDVDEIVETVKRISPTYGGINLEDISAPRCFEIERRLIEECDIPIFHDDQHGTAVVCLAGLINALKIVGKDVADVRIVMSGSGAGGIAIAKLMMKYGVKDVTLVDSKGIIYEGREGLNWIKEEMAKITNRERRVGELDDALRGADVFIGVSKAELVSREMVESMAKDAIIFSMANPVPEIMPDEAYRGGAKVVATGRSDFPNQVNNALVFPGLFRGVLDARAKKITDEMKLAAAEALAGMVKDPVPEKIIPGLFDEGVADVIAEAVKKLA